MDSADEIEGALRSALMTMRIAACILERDGDEHGVAWNLRNEIARGQAALGITEPAAVGAGIGMDEAPPVLDAAGVAHYNDLRDRFCKRPA